MGQIQPEAELFQPQKPEAGDQLAGSPGIVEMSDHQAKRVVESGMGVALGQQPQMRGQYLEPVDGDGAVHQPGGVHLQRLGLESAEMLVEARAPDEVDAVAGLEHRL